MEFLFLGTSAGEQYPGFWCKCENCSKARELRGKNIRKNSCAFISPDTLIDFPPEIFMQAERFSCKVIDVEYLLVTHSHEDHFYPWMLGWRRMPSGMTLPPKKTVVGPRFSFLKTLHIYGNERVYEGVKKYVSGNLEEFAIELHLVRPFCEYEAGGMRILPIEANHPDGDQRGLNYIITREGKTILYALDTGWFLPETYERIRNEIYNLVVIEGTFGYGAENEAHMNFRKVEESLRLFQREGLLAKGALFCVSHICPHFTPPHDKIAPLMAEKGITVAYDGMEVKL